MAEVAEKRLTFEEFTAVSHVGRCELVNGRLDELVSPNLFHGRAGGRIFAYIDAYVSQHEPGAYVGVEVDMPTLPYYGRRPDVLYCTASEVNANLDMKAGRVVGAPTLVVEVVSPDDAKRDTLTKRHEYAQVGIQHYWIFDPRQGSALTLLLEDSKYKELARFSGEDVVTSPLFPGLEIPLSRLFR